MLLLLWLLCCLLFVLCRSGCIIIIYTSIINNIYIYFFFKIRCYGGGGSINPPSSTTTTTKKTNHPPNADIHTYIPHTMPPPPNSLHPKKHIPLWVFLGGTTNIFFYMQALSVVKNRSGITIPPNPITHTEQPPRPAAEKNKKKNNTFCILVV